MPDFDKMKKQTRSGGGPFAMGSYGQGKNPIMLTKEGKEKIMASDANPNFKKAIANSPIDMYGKKGSMAPMKGKMGGKKSPNPDFDTKGSMAPKKGYAPGQLAAIHASKAEKKKK